MNKKLFSIWKGIIFIWKVEQVLYKKRKKQRYMKEIVDRLSPSERKFLLIYSEKGFKQVKKELNEAELLRVLNSLSDKKILEYKTIEKEFYQPTKLAEKYLKKGLPERQILEELNKKKKISELKITSQELNASIGILKKEKAIDIEKREELELQRTEKGEELLKQKLQSELKLEKLKESKIEDKEVKELIKRGLAEKKKKTEFKIIKCETSKEFLKKVREAEELVEKLTPDMLKEKTWEGKKFRKYNLDMTFPALDHGRKHFVREAKEYVKSIWLELGFEEMKGNNVQSAFWNLDALFIPQDHPARDMQDTFYVDKKSKLPEEKEKVKKMQEKAWGSFDERKAQETLLRTHTTVLTAQKLASLKKEDLPKKYFSLGKVFRNEALDWKHLFEFHQVEGIVIDDKANLKSLKSYLKIFFGKMGYSDVRMRPAYFPYTEPSMEVDAYNEEKGEWVEIAGAGIIRPEISKALLGYEQRILAWGIGLERIISSYYNITDIRELYSNNIKGIKEKKIFLK